MVARFAFVALAAAGFTMIVGLAAQQSVLVCGLAAVVVANLAVVGVAIFRYVRADRSRDGSPAAVFDPYPSASRTVTTPGSRRPG